MPNGKKISRVFWHQHLQNDFSDPATFLVSEILHLPAHTFRRRYTHIFFVFFFSGIYHQIQDFSTILPWHKSHTLRFFVTQALGILLEDHVQQIAYHHRRRCIRSSSAGVATTCQGNNNINGNEGEEEEEEVENSQRIRSDKSIWARKVLGHIWVSVFMIWSTPAWFYPAAHQIRHQAGMP